MIASNPPSLTTRNAETNMASKEINAMETLNVDLPESMRQFVHARVSELGFGGASEYVRELIQADQRREAEDRIDSLLIQGLEFGDPIPVKNDYWARRKRRTERLGEIIQPQG